MIRPVFALFALAVASGQNPFGTPADAETGKGMFRIYCSPCHGIRAQGGRGPDLTRGVYHSGDRDEDLYRIIADGNPATEMPSYAGSLGNDNIWRVVAYLRSVAKPSTEAAAGDRAAGEHLFWGKGACGQCHRVGSRGGRSGPPLTLVGRSRGLAYLRNSLIDPDLDISPGFATIVVVTHSGQTITGVERSYDNFSGQFLDRDGNYHSYLKSEVRSLERSMKSLMPAYRQLPERELNDLLAYLQSLKGTK